MDVPNMEDLKNQQAKQQQQAEQEDQRRQILEQILEPKAQERYNK